MAKISKKQQRLILEKMGIDFKDSPKKDIGTRIEEGKEKHRKYLQDLKNEEIKKDPNREENKPKVFFYRGQESPGYSSLRDLFLNKNWEE